MIFGWSVAGLTSMSSVSGWFEMFLSIQYKARPTVYKHCVEHL